METDHTERATRGGRTLRSTEKRFKQGVGGERLINMMFKIIQNNLQIIAKNKEGFVRQRKESRGLTGGLVAAFKDSISAWVIQTLLVDCRKQKET